MSRRRQLELITGLTSGILGILVLVLEVVGYGTVQQFEVSTVIFFIVVFLGFAGVAAGSYLHGRRQVGVGLNLLWASTALPAGCVFVGLASVGCLLFPATFLALISAVAGSFREPSRDAAR